MNPHLPIHRAFVEAFNQQDLQALRGLLDDDATAQVVGADFPTEQGRDVIARTSLLYLLDLEARLGAEVVEIDGDAWFALRAEQGQGPIDTMIRVEVRRGRIGRLEYVVAPHRPAELRRLGRACGLPTVADA